MLSKSELIVRCTGDHLRGQGYTHLGILDAPLAAQRCTVFRCRPEELDWLAERCADSTLAQRYLRGEVNIQPLTDTDVAFYSAVLTLQRAGKHVVHVLHNHKPKSIWDLSCLLEAWDT